MQHTTNPKMTQFIALLLEEHNLVTLLNARKTTIKTPKDRKWYKITSLELKKLNDKILTYQNEFFELTSKLANTQHEQQFLILKKTYEDKYSNNLTLRMHAIRKQKTTLLNALNKL